MGFLNMKVLLRANIAQRLFLIALPLALCLLLLFPGISEAHAILVRSDPARNSVINVAPTQVRMWFTEDLNSTFSTARVVNGSNQQVDEKNAHISSSDTREMDVNLPPNLPPAVYVVIYRTQSADDGHVLTGSFIFTVANPDGSTPKLNGALPGQGSLGSGNTTTGSSTGQLDGPTLFNLIMVTLVELGVVFWVGAQLWRSFVLQLIERKEQGQQAILQRVEQRFDRTFALPTLLLIFLANIGVLLGQAVSLTAGQWNQAFAPAMLFGLVSSGHFGTYWIMRQVVVLLAMLLTVYMIFVRRHLQVIESILPWANLLLGLALLIAVTLSGHASAVSSNVLVYAVLSDWLHLLAASLWVGGIMYIATTYLPILRGSSLKERVASLLAVLPRYSPLALAGVLIMTITGPFNATVHMNSWEQFISTAYGRTLIVKVLLVGGLLLTSAIHVGLFRPRLAKNYKKYLAVTDAAQSPTSGTTPFTAQEAKIVERRIARQSKRLIDTLRLEPLLGVAVLLCTGLLTVFAGTLTPVTPAQPQQPQTPVAPSKPFTTTMKTTDGKFTFTLNVTPNQFGDNVFTVSVLDSKGQPDTNVGVSLYTTMLDMSMGTDAVNLQPDGKGRFSAHGTLDMGGNWQIRVQIRAPDDTLHEQKVKFFTPS